jgi:hypothetical protein
MAAIRDSRVQEVSPVPSASPPSPASAVPVSLVATGISFWISQVSEQVHYNTI